MDTNKQGKKVAIIMAFNYALCHGIYHQFPATIADIYLSYNWARHIKCNPILIVTDNTEKAITKQILDLVVEGEIDSEIESFYRKNINIHHYINIDIFEKTIKEITEDASRIFFYYSGHGIYGDLILPNYNHNAGYIKSVGVQRISIEDILLPIIQNSLLTSQIVLIFDSCESSNANLPFEWIKNRFVFKGTHTYGVYGGREIISISSSAKGSYASHDGSHFTTHLFNLWKNRNGINIKTLLDELNKINIEGASVRVSDPTLKYIPLWLFNSSLSDVKYMHYCQSFIIDRG